MIPIVNSKQFLMDMNNIVNYSIGFLDGVQLGKNKFLQLFGNNILETIKEFIDSNARVNPAMLDHVYEWYQTGSPEGRLFNIDYTVSGLGLSFKSTFSQSKSIQSGSTVPFYDKARIMENGIPVTIKPRKSDVLVFDQDGETVFTRKPVTVMNPGGPDAKGAFEKTFDLFFESYFTQAFIRSSGLSAYLQNPEVFKKDLPAGKKSGKSQGIKTGYRWITNVGVMN